MQTFQTLNDFLNSNLPCSPSDAVCLQNIPTDDVLDTSLQIFSSAISLDASAGAFMPMRPVVDGRLITSPLDATASFPSQSKSIIVSTVQNEAGPTIYSSFTTSLSKNDYEGVVEGTLGATRSAVLLTSNNYLVPNATNSSIAVDARVQLEALGTDQVWRCPSWTFARLWAAAGGRAYVGKYAVGVTYPDNAGIAFCTDGAVCHEDDIEVVFGTASAPSQSQKSLIDQVRGRLKSFLTSGSPNSFGSEPWSPVSGNETDALVLGGSGGKAAVGGCDANFWGAEVPYDYQLFDD